jgi:hypothetical protein
LLLFGLYCQVIHILNPDYEGLCGEPGSWEGGDSG